MAGSFTDVLEIDFLKAITAQTTTIITTTALASVHVSLHTTGSSDATAGTEVSTSGTAYARQDSKTKWATPSAGSVQTNATVAYPTATASWGTVTDMELNTAVTAGNRLAWGTLTASKTVDNGDTLSFASGALVVTLD